MPNHVTTRCTITGSADQVAQFRNLMIREMTDDKEKWNILDFNAAIPMPATCLKVRSRYDWSIANWGTKWNSYSFAIISENPFTIKFETAWNFPLPVFQKIAEMFPALKFDCICFDEGWNFAGEGCFNGAPQFATSKELATDAIYERVYGHKPDSDDGRGRVNAA